MSSAVDLEAFRAAVASFVRQALPADIREKVRLGIELSRDDKLVWERKLRDRGWLVPP